MRFVMILIFLQLDKLWIKPLCDTGLVLRWTSLFWKGCKIKWKLHVSALELTAIARFFVMGGERGRIIASLEGGAGGILPQKFSNLEALKCYFQHLSWDVSEKSTWGMKMANNCKSLSSEKLSLKKTNPSKDCLDVSGSTGPGGGGAADPLPPR